MPNVARCHENTAKRDQKGRFLPGTKPPRSPGRPPGPNGVRAQAARLASEKLEALLGQAATVIENALDEGDARVATWVIDRIRPPGRSDYAHMSEKPQLSTIAGVIAASESAVRAAGCGELSLQDAKAYQEILTRHAELKGLEDLAKLNAKLDELASSSKRSNALDNSHLPTWGRLREAGQ